MGTTADKLQALINGKQLLVNNINTKAGTNYTINSKLTDIANSVLDISSGGGGDTSDATATADDILLGKTAYANNTKIEGTIETYDGSNSDGTGSSGGTGGGGGTGSSVGYQVKSISFSLPDEGLVFYSLDNGTNWVDCYLYHKRLWLFNVTKILFKVSYTSTWTLFGILESTKLGFNMDATYGEQIVECELTEDVTDIVVYHKYNTGAGD